MGQKRNQHVHAGKDEIDEGWIDRAPPCSENFQYRLEVMSQAVDRVELQETRSALERMEGPEQHLDRGYIFWVLLQRQHRGLNLFEQPAGFAAEFGEKVCIIDEIQQDRNIQPM